MAKVFANETGARRYTLTIDGALASVLDYAILRNAISLPHTFTTPPFRGKGYAGELVEYAVNDIEATTGYRVVPMCWYVAQWFEEHPERAGLLSR
jgi:uncharacterized protein